MHMRNNDSDKIVKAILAAAVGSVALGMPAARAATTGTLATVSTSGSTALRGAIVGDLTGTTLTSPRVGLTFQEQNSTRTFTSGTFVNGSGSLQLAPGIYNATAGAGEANALRLEWHEQGSVEGILELVNDQIGSLPASLQQSRNPSSTNPVWVNRNRFAAANTGPNPPGNYVLDNFGTANGQSAVQLAFSDVVAKQGFARSIGTGTGSWNATPNADGYGRGNSLLPVGPIASGIGSVSARNSLAEESVLNVGGRTGGTNNLQSKELAITATLFVANPGTGLTKANRTDAQWLQTTGRLKNGADFNMTTRDAFSGTRNVIALSTGVDPSFASGENDGAAGTDGSVVNSVTTANETVIGADIKYSNKTAGGGQLRPTVQNARMAVGVLSLGDANGVTKVGNARPLRALDYKDTDDSTAGSYIRVSADTIATGKYTIYQAEQLVTVKTAATVNSADPDIQGDTNIGTNGPHDVREFRTNILHAVATNATATSVANPADNLISAGFLLPQMTANFKDVNQPGAGTARSTDTVNITQQDTTAFGTPDSGNGTDPNANGTLFFASSNTLKSKFKVDDPSTITAGTSSTYGNIATGSGGITITSKLANGSIATAGTSESLTPKGNWLFGNFNQDGVRDFSALKAAQAAQATLYGSGTLNTNMSTNSAGFTNTTPIGGLNSNLSTANTKGDLIVMGDFDGNGTFDGKDLYLFARGAALSDSTLDQNGALATDQLTSLTGSDLDARIHGGLSRKNDALDHLKNNATAQQKLDARVVLNTTGSLPTGATQIGSTTGGVTTYTFDPNGDRAFDKADVNRDGKIDINDAAIVDKFITKDYADIGHQVAATINVDGTIAAGTQRSISLIDVKLNNTAVTTITHQLVSGKSDFSVIRAAVGTKLNPGDINFDKTVDIADFDALRTNFGVPNRKWSHGDIAGPGGAGDFDGSVDISDFDVLRTNFGGNGTNIIAQSNNSGGTPFNITPAPTPAAVADTVKLVIDRNTGEVAIIGTDVDKEELTSYQIKDNAKPPGTQGRFNSFVFSHVDESTDEGMAGTALHYTAATAAFSVLSMTDSNVAEGRISSRTLVGTAGLTLGNIFRTGFLDETGLVFTYGALENNATEGIQTGIIEFVPEPGSASLLGIAAIAMVRRRRRA